MPKFLAKSKIQMDGKTYEPGEAIELTDEQAAAMPWAAGAVKEEAKPADIPPAGDGANQTDAPPEQPIIEEGADTSAASEEAAPDEQASAQAPQAPRRKKK